MEAGPVYSKKILLGNLQKIDMKIKEGFRMRRLCKEYIVTGEGVERINFNKMIVLNDSAAFLWQAFEDGGEFTPETLAEKLVEKYQIDMETALKDSKAIVQKWIEAGIVSE